MKLEGWSLLNLFLLFYGMTDGVGWVLTVRNKLRKSTAFVMIGVMDIMGPEMSSV